MNKNSFRHMNLLPRLEFDNPNKLYQFLKVKTYVKPKHSKDVIVEYILDTSHMRVH